MLNYPNSYTSIDADEFEYLTGGATELGLTCSIANIGISLMILFDTYHIKRELRSQNPERSNALLTLDACNAYMEKPYGKMMMVTSTILLVCGVIL